MTDEEPAIRDLEARIDDLETAVRDLRHTVSELGRRLAMDLPQVLARHRDAIISALTPVSEVDPAVPYRVAHPDVANPPPPDPERPPEMDLAVTEERPGSATPDRARKPLRRRRGGVF